VAFSSLHQGERPLPEKSKNCSEETERRAEPAEGHLEAADGHMRHLVAVHQSSKLLLRENGTLDLEQR